MMSCRTALTLSLLLLCGGSLAAAADAPGAKPARPWPPQKAQEWYKAQPWIVGCNFIPSTIVNWTEMWQADTFDPAIIDRELGLAAGLGMNTARVFFCFAAWEADPAGFQDRFERFLKIADQHKIAVIPVFFDDCVIGVRGTEPKAGKQPRPLPGQMFSSWTPSPGHKRSQDRASWPKFQEYVQSTIRRHANDPRVRMWDLYNEISQKFSLALLTSAFAWAQEVNPDQPITATLYGTPDESKVIFSQSDVLTFHNYGPLAAVQKDIKTLSKHGRPLICTEWLARGYGSRVETHLQFFKTEGIGAVNWGLVNGLSQTHLPWGTNKPEGQLWHHDLFRKDGRPYSEAEVAIFRQVTGKTPKEK